LQRITRDAARHYVLDRRASPALVVDPGESFIVETEDAYSGYVHALEDLERPEYVALDTSTPPLGNPVAGPIYVRGCQKGDLIAVTVERIEVGEVGITGSSPDVGPVGDSQRWAEVRGPFIQTIQHLPGPSGTRLDGRGYVDDRVSWILRPLIGTIGTAPEIEVETSGAGQGPWGGNIDCRDITTGNTVYLNCFNEGALLYLGDVHGSQGDTEFSGTADETCAEVQVRCEVIKNKRIPFLRVERPDAIIAIRCDKPLERAVSAAMFDLMSWLVEEYGFTRHQAFLHCCLNPDVRVNVYQMVELGRLRFTAGVEMPKIYLR
jgi:acetamidase/formamidase